MHFISSTRFTPLSPILFGALGTLVAIGSLTVACGDSTSGVGGSTVGSTGTQLMTTANGATNVAAANGTAVGNGAGNGTGAGNGASGADVGSGANNAAANQAAGDQAAGNQAAGNQAAAGGDQFMSDLGGCGGVTVDAVIRADKNGQLSPAYLEIPAGSIVRFEPAQNTGLRSQAGNFQTATGEVACVSITRAGVYSFDSSGAESGAITVRVN